MPNFFLQTKDTFTSIFGSRLVEDHSPPSFQELCVSCAKSYEQEDVKSQIRRHFVLKFCVPAAYSPVFWMKSVFVVWKTFLSKNTLVCKLASNWKGIANDAPLKHKCSSKNLFFQSRGASKSAKRSLGQSSISRYDGHTKSRVTQERVGRAQMYLRFAPDSHDFADIVYEAREVEPRFVRMCLADAFSCLESMNWVWNVNLPTKHNQHLKQFGQKWFQFKQQQQQQQ